MQTPPSPSRINRIPRATPARIGLCRRLHKWFSRRLLITRIANLEEAKRDLQRLIAMDQAAAAAHRIHYTKSPVLQDRMQRERNEFLLLTMDLGLAKADLAALEAQP